MNLVTRIINGIRNRRKHDCQVKDDRRQSVGARLNAATNRVDSAIDDLGQTVSMSRAELQRRMDTDK
mgnify:CR=1 FL=1